MPSLPEETSFDNPLYGDFEDYLDDALPEARRREVENLLERSPAARALLGELIAARAWLSETRWEIPEPVRWPSAEAILSRAGRRPAPAKGWRSGWRAAWRARFASPAWALGAAACLALLLGGGLWRMLSPPSPDEVAQSSQPQPPSGAAEPPAAPSAPESAALAEESPLPEGLRPGRAPRLDQREPRQDQGKKPLSQVSPAAAPDAESLESAARAPASPMASAPPAPAPSVAGEASPRAERAAESRDQAHALAAGAPGASLETRKEAARDGRAPADAPQKAAAQRADEASAARSRSSAADAGAPATVTLRLVVMDRARAAAQATAVARAFGGGARLSGERMTVAVPAARVADCAARLRARIATAAEGQPLLITVRAQE